MNRFKVKYDPDRIVRLDYYPTTWLGKIFMPKKRVLKLSETTWQTRLQYARVVGEDSLLDLKSSDGEESNIIAEQIDKVAIALAILIVNDGKPNPPEWIVRSLKKESASSLLGFIMHTEWMLNNLAFGMVLTKVLALGINED